MARSYRGRHVDPGVIHLALELPKVDGRDRERGVVEEGADRLDRGAGVATELRRGVAEDVEPGRGETAAAAEVAAEPRVERAAA